MAYENIMKSYDAGVSPTLVDYFQRKALENVEPNLGYGKDAQMIEQPEHNGKHVHFHRFTELPAITTPLQEGVTPSGQKITETEFSVMTKPYGGHVEITDEFNLNHIDNMTKAVADRLTRQAKLSIDTIIRDQISAGLNVMYPASVSSRAGIGTSNIINYSMIKRAVRLLKNKGAQPFPDGYYHAKIDHDTYFDLCADTGHWMDVATYQDDTRVQKYELGCVYKVKFFEMDNGKTFVAETYLYGEKEYLDGAATFDRDNRTLTVSDTISEDEARELTGKLVEIHRDGTGSGDVVTPMCVEYVDAAAKKVKFRWVPAKSETDNWTTAKNVEIHPTGGSSTSNLVVHSTLIYGQDAFGIVKLGGKGQPNIQTIIKPVGSSGSDDPENQRGSIAWKVKHFCAAILQDDFIVRLEHAVSA